MSSDHQSYYDVVVAGAGPVGLFLACELGLAGCSVLVVERAATAETPLKRLPFGLRGLTLPTIDSLDCRGLLALLKKRAAAADVKPSPPWTGGERKPAGHFAGLQFFRDRVDETAWPERLGGAREVMAVTMANLEAVLIDRLAELGVTIRYDCGIEAFEPSEGGVTIRAGAERCHASWLVGCDGARSTVRKAAGIGFAGTEPEITGYSVQLELDQPHHLRPGRHHTAAGMYTFAPPSVITMADFDGGAHHRTTSLSREHVEAVLRRVSGTDVRIAALGLATTWTDRAYLASRYRAGRVLLAGDAAHIHAPLGGQGLNLGIGDAVNLAPKLAAVIQDEATEAILDGYELERRPIAEQVLDWSRAQVALMRPDRGAAALRAIVRDLMETEDGATYFAGRVWGTLLQSHDGYFTPIVPAPVS